MNEVQGMHGKLHGQTVKQPLSYKITETYFTLSTQRSKFEFLFVAPIHFPQK